jgi:hypothetical protein
MAAKQLSILSATGNGLKFLRSIWANLDKVIFLAGHGPLGPGSFAKKMPHFQNISVA